MRRFRTRLAVTVFFVALFLSLFGRSALGGDPTPLPDPTPLADPTFPDDPGDGSTPSTALL